MELIQDDYMLEYRILYIPHYYLLSAGIIFFLHSSSLAEKEKKYLMGALFNAVCVSYFSISGLGIKMVGRLGSFLFV